MENENSDFDITMKVIFKLKGSKEKITETYKILPFQWDVIRSVINLDKGA